MNFSKMFKLPNLNLNDTIRDVGSVIDDLHLSGEEAGAIKIKMSEAITRRWEADQSSDSWLSKNIRPLLLGHLILVISALAIADGNFGGITIKENWVELFAMLATTAVVSYFGGRSFEKRNK